MNFLFYKRKLLGNMHTLKPSIKDVSLWQSYECKIHNGNLYDDDNLLL